MALRTCHAQARIGHRRERKVLPRRLGSQRVMTRRDMGLELLPAREQTAVGSQYATRCGSICRRYSCRVRCLYRCPGPRHRGRDRSARPTPYNEEYPGPRLVGAWMARGLHHRPAAANRRPVP